ncbi:hypothetical protein LAZ67_16000844 [Cordylochernes scorpioides]|uniref:Uncharacterized protein n=1 Tax=Cordylochernes scorpioides TaxID=51811 RepID=A0ABY6LDJ2_9ARAC|nr:hypothetical protein LAZ67_16000844 [Cordylochernes scorpioides]
MENQARSDATSEGNTTPSIVTDIVAQLAAALRDIVNPGQRDSDLPRYDGTYPAANFFQQYDDIADRAYLTGTKRLQKLPAQLSALKLTPQTTLQGYYKEKTAMGLQLNLPTDIILESLTEGLPTADQRLVRSVSPNTLKDWHDLMARIKAPLDCLAMQIQVCHRNPRHHATTVGEITGTPSVRADNHLVETMCFTKKLRGVSRGHLSPPPGHSQHGSPSSDTTVQTTPRSEEIGELSSHIDPYPPVEEARKIAIKRTLDRHAKEKIKYDSKHRTPQFEVGDIVLVKAYHHPNSDSPVTKSRQDSGRQGTSKQVDHCLYRKMEQGREENPKEPMESDPDSESGENTFPKKENTLDVRGRLTTTLHQLSAVTGHRERWNRYDGSYEAQSFFTNYDAQADRAQLQYSTRLRKPANLLQAPLRVTNTRACVAFHHDCTGELTSRFVEHQSRQDSGRQGTSKQIDHCLYRKMEQGREENPKEPMESDPDSESGENTFPKKENTLGRTEEIAPGQEDVTPPPPVSDVLGRLTTTLHQLSAVTGHRERWNRYDGSYEAQSFFTNYDAQADRAQLLFSTRLRKPPNLLQAPLRVTNTRAQNSNLYTTFSGYVSHQYNGIFDFLTSYQKNYEIETPPVLMRAKAQNHAFRDLRCLPRNANLLEKSYQKINRERASTSRAAESVGQRENRLQQERDRASTSRAAESLEQRENRLQQERDRASTSRAAESVGQRENRLRQKRNRASTSRAAESVGQRENRLQQDRDRASTSRAAESLGQRENRLQQERDRASTSRAAESLEQRENRLQQERDRASTSRAAESVGQRENRLRQNRNRASTSRAAESLEQRENRLQQERDRASTSRAAESVGQRENRLRQNRNRYNGVYDFLTSYQKNYEIETPSGLMRIKAQNHGIQVVFLS